MDAISQFCEHTGSDEAFTRKMMKQIDTIARGKDGFENVQIVLGMCITAMHDHYGAEQMTKVLAEVMEASANMAAVRQVHKSRAH
ncbi:hypothetical protein [Endozoicomonas ascidiicola]|uniref:hypothetical protein n=1 Tax=Endozoicomonas ascidiicola TaxID=1698521 RepID=UPI00082B4DB9|nr:hypothetical protein [Endozoicomonas ascidiicola]